jgi:small subunit ribosomal protein S18
MATTETRPMSRFARFGNTPKIKVAKKTSAGKTFVDYKDVETLRRLMSPNGKIYGRKRLQTSAAEQRMIAQAIKRARYMGLLPYTSATL